MATKAYYQELASLSGWDIAKRLGCHYSGDSDPIQHDGFFYDVRDWENYRHANVVEFWNDVDNKRLVIQRGTIDSPDGPIHGGEWMEVWKSFGLSPTINIYAQIEACRYAKGIVPDGTAYPDVMTYKWNEWQDWRIWKSCEHWIRELSH